MLAPVVEEEAVAGGVVDVGVVGVAVKLAAPTQANPPPNPAVDAEVPEEEAVAGGVSLTTRFCSLSSLRS